MKRAVTAVCLVAAGLLAPPAGAAGPDKGPMAYWVEPVRPGKPGLDDVRITVNVTSSGRPAVVVYAPVSMAFAEVHEAGADGGWTVYREGTSPCPAPCVEHAAGGTLDRTFDVEIQDHVFVDANTTEAVLGGKDAGGYRLRRRRVTARRVTAEQMSTGVRLGPLRAEAMTADATLPGSKGASYGFGVAPCELRGVPGGAGELSDGRMIDHLDCNSGYGNAIAELYAVGAREWSIEIDIPLAGVASTGTRFVVFYF